MKYSAPPSSISKNNFNKIYEINDFLPKLKQIILWEIFHPSHEPIHHKERLSKAAIDKNNESREWIAAQ